MNTVDWVRIQPLFEAALEQAPANRAGYVDEICPEPALRKALASLLVAWDEAGEFLEIPAMSPSAPETPLPRGHRLGPYQIEEVMGRGGMGSVYRAIRADDQYEKAVAIKVVSSGLASAATLAGFRAERQILAHLEHPNIARLLDGGTEDGAPWLAMELVEGEPIDRYCDRLCLSIRERLKLFRSVCSAVQYAHQHLVVHSDIKPSNILVTSGGVPKLLDFGIAKLLGSTPVQEQSGCGPMLMMTPDFASPEQMRGEAVTPASDIYSLGVLLYLLVTGRSPYSFPPQGALDIKKTVCEWSPLRPSSVIHLPDCAGGRAPELLSSLREGAPRKLRQKLKGDLDHIVMKAMNKVPAGRYDSVHLLSEDVANYLEGWPVKARETTVLYRAAKFIGRNRTGFVAGVLIVLTLLAGLYATAREARIANRRFNDIRNIASSDLFEVHDALEKIPGSASLRYRVVQRALKYLDKLNSEHLADATLLADIASGYERVAGLQGNFSAEGIGDSKDSLTSYAHALAIRDSIPGASSNADSLNAEATLLSKYSRMLHIMGKTAESLRIAERELATAQALVKRRPTAVGTLANAHKSVAFVLGGSGSSSSLRDIPAAIEHTKAALANLNRATRGKTDQQEAALTQANLLLAVYYSTARQFSEARAVFDRIMPSDQMKVLDAATLDHVHNQFGLMMERSDDQPGALSEYRKELAAAKSMVEADPNDLNGQSSLQIALGHIGMQETRLGVRGAATTALDAAVGGLEKLWAADPSQTFFANLLLIGYAYQAEALSLHADQKSALAKYRQSFTTAQQLARDDSADLESRLSIAKLHQAIGIVLARAGELPEARGELNASARAAQDLLQSRPGDTEADYVFRETRSAQSAVSACSATGPCPASFRLRLPVLIN